MSKKVYTFKTNYRDGNLSGITSDIICKNYESGRVTKIILDTNILIDIGDAYQSGMRHKKLKEVGIIDFLKVIKDKGSKQVFLSPGAAYRELPESRKKNLARAFDLFTNDYLPDFSDDLNEKRVEFSEEGESDYFFKDIHPEYQKFLACPYVSLIAIHIIDTFSELNELEKFNLYLKFVSDGLDFVSAQELNIARYVFSPEIGITEELRIRRRDIRRNFSKIKKDKKMDRSKRIMKMALNGSMDIGILNVASITDSKSNSINGVEMLMDVWIATSDEKLFNFSQSCLGVLRSPTGFPYARCVDSHEDIKGTNYWVETSRLIQENEKKRKDKFFRKVYMSRIVRIAHLLDKKLEEDNVENYFLDEEYNSTFH